MAQMTSLRIDSAIKPTSPLRMRLYISLSSAMIILAWLADLSLLQYVLIFSVSSAAAWYLVLSRPIMLHLSQPPLSQRATQGWQLLMRTSRGDALWQANLRTIHRYHWLIHFEFVIVEPYQRTLSMTIFRDQVSIDEWQTPNVLATVIPMNAP